jgi:AraC-like DNA-binding protein
VCFKGPRVERFIECGLLSLDPTRPLVKIARPERFMASMLELIETLNSTPRRYARSVLLLEDLLLQLSEQPVENFEVNARLKTVLSRLADEIRERPYLDWDFKKEALATGVSYPHFRRIFKRLFDMAPWRFVIETRLLRAAEMLSRSDEQISVVAENCGFDDSFYFSRLFKKYHHMSPSRYRREFQA